MIAGTSTLTASGHADLASPGGATVSATVYDGSPISSQVNAAAAGLPTTMSAAEIAAMNTGRLPVGVRSGQAGQVYDVSYTDTVTPSITVTTGVVLDVELRLVRTVQVTVPGRGPVSAGTALQATGSSTPATVAAGFGRVADAAQQRSNHQVFTQVLPALLVIFAVVLLALGVPKLVRPKERSAAVVNGDRPESREQVTDLANVGVQAGDENRRPGG
jgi:high-affinity iron transporter